MSEWIELPLDRLADISSGGTPSRANPQFWGGDIPWVTPSDITVCRTNHLFDVRDSITEKGLAASSAKPLPKGTLLLTSRASIGELRIAARPLTTNQGFKNIVANELIDSDFLFYQLNRLKNSFLRYAAGSTFLEINRKDTGRVIVPHPTSKNEQKKIAQILKTIDQAIEKTEALIDKYQKIKAGLMHDLFTRGIGPDGQLRPPREQTPELYQETPIGWIPKEWEFDQVASLINGIEQGWSPDCDSEPASMSEWGVLKTTSVQWDGFRRDENKRLPRHFAPKLSYEIEQGDLLLTRAGPNSRVGVVSIVSEEPGKLLLSDKLYRINSNERVEPEYLELALSSEGTQRFLDGFKTGLAESQTNISQKIVKELLVALPSKKERHLIVESMRLVRENINCLHCERRKLQQQKFGLMHDLLIGDAPTQVESEVEKVAEII
jgi:type I restriction enzyme S subunit